MEHFESAPLVPLLDALCSIEILSPSGQMTSDKMQGAQISGKEINLREYAKECCPHSDPINAGRQKCIHSGSSNLSVINHLHNGRGPEQSIQGLSDARPGLEAVVFNLLAPSTQRVEMGFLYWEIVFTRFEGAISDTL
ncbi:hypothetical protein NPIL_46191 [Nephila pilipes]|uniref:Uncharacterized protein n=1 Tax=Nephila pilipes TaxID=299642 RepID=A0A8X6UXN6_NEPPI|nr:hypothetical protein NPIL_46191 [Nephila pilipes]